VDGETVRVEGYHEVLALHRMLMECKSDALGSVYAGSPFIAAIQHRLADALEAADPGQGGMTGGTPMVILTASRPSVPT
jgi:hypothetical protein